MPDPKLIKSNETFRGQVGRRELAEREAKVRGHVEGMLDAMGFDWRNDTNARDTPRRVAKMWMQELLAGCYEPPPRLTVFDNTLGYSNLISTGPIEVRSTCAHHWMPIVGTCVIAMLPSEHADAAQPSKMMGLSKASRVVRWIAARFQIQENMTNQIADYLMEQLQPAGLGVMIIAEHHCVSHRGVREHDSRTMTTALRGLLLSDPSLKQEFIANYNTLLERAKR